MIEISIQISELINYDIQLPKVITSESFPEIMKRLKAINEMLPKETLLELKKGTSPLIQLPLEQSNFIYNLYKKSTPESFVEYLKEEYDIDEEKLERSKLVSLMGRLKKRISDLKSGEYT